MNAEDTPLEVATVADDEVVAYRGTEMLRVDGVPPDTEVDISGRLVRTLSRPGELLSTFTTANDVHFGEQIAGHIDGLDEFETFSVPEGSEPYPEFMNAGAVAEMAAISPELVVVKGDLTSNGTAEEYDRFVEVYGGAFGDRLLHVRGNHESYHHLDRAAWPMQERHLDGVAIALLDTSREGLPNGILTAEQIDWLDELGSRADRPVMVFGHHPIWNELEEERKDSTFGLTPDATDALVEVFRRRPHLVGYFAGHTHRNRVLTIPGVSAPFVEVACVKDFPGTWAEYRVFDGGIEQIHRRISTPEALRWSELTRNMFGGLYQAYALGPLSHRGFVIDTRGLAR